MLGMFFDPSRIKLNLESRTKDDVLEELVSMIAESCPEYDEQELLEAIILREEKMATIVMPGIAMPHGHCEAIHGIIGAIGISREGIEYDELDEDPVHLFFMLLMDESSKERDLRVFSHLLEMLHSTSFDVIKSMASSRELYDLLCDF